MKALALDDRGILSHADRAAWFNATEIAAMFEKRPIDWLRLPETERYITALCQNYEVRKSHFVKAKRGGNTALQGTWLHPKLAIRFAQWLDIQFAIWCDEQIERLLTEQPAWRQQRRELGSITRLKNRLLQEQRAALGKDTQPYHYSNEALMENEALTGRREPIDRDSLPMEKLAMLDTIQAENAVMIAQGIPSATRKARLFAIAAPIREAA